MEAAAEYPRQWLFSSAGVACETKAHANKPCGGAAPAPCEGRAPSMFGNVFNVITKLWALTTRSPNVNKPSELPAYATGTKQWHSVDKEGPAHLSTVMPIFETTDCGMSQLTVPVDYGSYELEDSMSAAGVYLQEAAPSIAGKADRTTSRSVPIRKRRRQPPATKTHSAPGSESGKGGCGKNRKNKKRHDLRRDIVSDSMALEMDDCYGYDYREAELLDESNESVPSVGQRYGLSTSFSPSSAGSATSFHDALQDVSILAACLRYADGLPEVTPVLAPAAAATAATTTTTTSTAVPPSSAVPLVMLNRKTSSSSTEGAGRLSYCDITEPEASFVMLTDYDVFTTPSASPARRSKNLCKAINSFLVPATAWHRQCTDDEDEEEEGEDEEDDEDDDDEDEDDDDEDQDYVGTGDGSDDDDDSVVFFEEDDSHDDGNSSSGFEERKVRFNTKPVVHVMRAWDFAYRQARKGEWEMAARDRERFRKHIADLEPVLGPALQPALRDRIYQQRFEPRDTADPVPVVHNTTLLSTPQEN
ncbi:armadillo-like helical domain-containing protein 4 [Anopheles aquasalis]|uniref:armadillo-like helical domain-containing protein 4 n=1 Tax=Anopheles aquasalis TaxID=42839 RepID=UPI00215B1BF8|nr:armadillo-like helical domain-containing protein 4 [Anopheles aquasalis]